MRERARSDVLRRELGRFGADWCKLMQNTVFTADFVTLALSCTKLSQGSLTTFFTTVFTTASWPSSSPPVFAPSGDCTLAVWDQSSQWNTKTWKRRASNPPMHPQLGPSLYLRILKAGSSSLPLLPFSRLLASQLRRVGCLRGDFLARLDRLLQSTLCLNVLTEAD